MARNDTAARRPPTPGGDPVVGQTIRFARDAFGCVGRLVDEHGGVVGLDVLGFDDLYVVADPEEIERALVSERDAFGKGRDFEAAFGDGIIAANGEAWREQRELMQPLFFMRRIREYTDEMVAQTERRIARWCPGERRPMLDEMKDLTLDVIFATIFGRELEVDGDERLRASAAGLNGRFSPASWALPAWVPTPARWRFERSARRLRREVTRLLEAAQPDGGDDLVSALAGALDSDGYPRSIEEVRDQLVVMTFAGHETTALALLYTWYLLATHPAVRERFHAELDDVLGGEPPSAGDLPRLEYTDRVLKESLRLYPPVHGIPRETTREVELGGYRIPAGSTLLLSTYVVHRDERFYDDPETFRPDRWDGDLESSIPDFAYFPFGGGPRRCLGQQFATVEAKTVLGTIGQRFRLEYDGSGLELAPKMTTLPAGTVPMVIRERGGVQGG